MYEKAAAQEYVPAQTNLGLMYDEGRGGPQDSLKAQKLYEKAAAQGDAEAQFNLGVMYYEGESVPQDFVEAYKWADIAAVGGLVEALELKEAAAVQMNQDSLMKAKALAQELLEKRKRRP